jgi:peptidoglycan hydrolase-like protein with peptidoglycan-binding domain
MNGHGRIAAVVLAVVIVAAAIGWVAGRQISSPAEVASRTAPPDAAPILVPAEERVLSTDIVTRGTARFGSPQQLSLATSALKSQPGVAAKLPAIGRELGEGDLVFTTSGRPVFLLTGEQPAFRDLGPGIEGEDVRQLEDALVRLGFNPGPVDGVYDGQTGDAVSQWYKNKGFTPFVASAEQLAAIRALETDGNSSQIDVIGARDAVVTEEAALDTARAAHARAISVSDAALLTLQREESLANANNKAAAAAVTARQTALNALKADPGTTAQEIAAAEVELALAQANVEVVRTTGDRDIANASAGLVAARADVSSALVDVRRAERALANANEALAVRTRQAELVASDLANAKLQAGVQVPADELIFVSSVPVRVSEVVGRVEQTSGPLITVTNAVVAVDGSLRLEEAVFAEPGMKVLIDEPDLGINATGVVSRVADAPGTNGVDGFHVYFEAIVDGSPASLVGASVRLTVPIESTGGSVLAVPVSAVTLAADGSSRIQRDVNGQLEYVTVEPGLSADGYVAVRPVGGPLEAGDLVVVGDQSSTTR